MDIISYQQVDYARVNVQKFRVSIDGRNDNMYIKTTYMYNAHTGISGIHITITQYGSTVYIGIAMVYPH